MPTRVITKALATEEDISLGKGGVTQTRGGKSLILHNLSVSKVVSNIAAFGADSTAAEFLDPALFSTVQVETYANTGDEGGGIFTWDPTINPLSADGGHIFASGVITALGAWRRFTDSSIINVRHFGAVGDGVVDDTVAIQLAVTAANTRIKGVLYFPSGTYKLSSTLDLTAMDNVIVRGDGIQNTIIDYIGAAGPFLKLDTGAEVDEQAQFAIVMDMTIRTNTIGLTGILITSTALLGDITRSAIFARLIFIGSTAANGWDFAIHSQDVRGITVKDVYARHVLGSVGTIFWNIDNTIAFADTTYTSTNNETHFYAADFGVIVPAGGGGGGSTPPLNSVTIGMLADATAGDIITYDATGNAILLPIAAAGTVLTSAGPGLPPVWVQLTSSDINNASAVPGVTVTNALDALGSSTINVQTFIVSGTWTKPGIGTLALITMLGGGGGGGNAITEGGGGGAAYNELLIDIASLGATETVVVGSGGPLATAGGTSSFGAILSSFGGGAGGAGLSISGGGGGGQTTLGSNGGPTIAGGNGGGPCPGLGGTNSINSDGADAIAGGGGGGFGGGLNPGGNGGSSVWGGGGGGGGVNTTVKAGDGGCSIRGGGGGGGDGAGVGTNGLGGVSAHGGNGGNVGLPGALPGGGGGKGGLGGAGKVTIYVF